MDAKQEIDEDEPDQLEMNSLLLRLMRGINGQAFRVFGNKINGGPFAGMIIPARNPSWDDGNSGTKLIGNYESELHDSIVRAVWRKPDVIINVGCAEGYYAIGLARLLLEAKVFAFDINSDSLEMCRKYAALNDVAHRVSVSRGCASPEELRLSISNKRRLYVMDCEGAEAKLLDPKKCPELFHSDIIVECHDFLEPGISSVIADRLGETHRIDLIVPAVPDLLHNQFMKMYSSAMAILLYIEKRPPGACWLTCWANKRD